MSNSRSGAESSAPTSTSSLGTWDWLAAVGGVLVWLMASVLPFHTSTQGASISAFGGVWGGLGLVLFALAVVGEVLRLLRVAVPRLAIFVAALLGLLCLLMAGFAPPAGAAGAAAGYWLALLGGAVGFIGALMALLGERSGGVAETTSSADVRAAAATAQAEEPSPSPSTSGADGGVDAPSPTEAARTVGAPAAADGTAVAKAGTDGAAASAARGSESVESDFPLAKAATARTGESAADRARADTNADVPRPRAATQRPPASDSDAALGAGAGQAGGAAAAADRPAGVTAAARSDQASKAPAGTGAAASRPDAAAGATASGGVADQGHGVYRGDNPPSGYVVKGNDDSMKFHTPASRWYDRTVAEVWFATPLDAIDAGYAPVASDEGARVYRGDNPPAGYVIKGNADSMKYHTPASPWYDRTVAEVWFGTATAAELCGYKPVHGDDGAEAQ
jgi:hypothetical protein